MQDDTLLTIEDAAELFVEPCQSLARLLEEGKIPCQLIGEVRKVRKSDVLAYKARRGAERRKIWDDLVRAEIEEGVYDLVPMPAPDVD